MIAGRGPQVESAGGYATLCDIVRAIPVRTGAASIMKLKRKAEDETRRDTAARIWQAADELFCERGFEGVSVADIASRAGVNKALVFYHYENKAELFERVVSRYYEAHREALASAFQNGGTLAERMHRLVDAYLDFMSENRRYAALVQQEVADSETHPLIQRNLRPLFEWFEKALAGVTDPEGPLAARHFFVTFSGITINYFTYSPLLAPAWNGDPLSSAALEERRAHVHWLVDALLAALENDRTKDKRAVPAPRKAR